MKSVSALWAVAPADVAQAIREAHDAAVSDALGFLETHGIFTREGTDGVRQVETRGLIAAAFTHRDSRAGDPDLHTHVAVANKVQTLDGKWLSIYGTVLHQYTVATSEAYNTALEHHLTDRLGLRFVDVAAGPGKRPVREIAGVDPMLCQMWSRRRRHITDRTGELTSEFTRTHGRPPTAKESIALAQRANLETRQAKHEPRSDADQRAAWHAEATQELGSMGLDRMFTTTLASTSSGTAGGVTPAWLGEAADRIIAELESHRATWQTWHLYAEAQRQVRNVDVAADQIPGVVEHLVNLAVGRSINLTPDLDTICEPGVLRRSDGISVFRHTGADHFTSPRILAAEQRIVDAAGSIHAASIDPVEAELAWMKAELDGVRLNPGQRALVQAMVADPRQVALALAPAGSGKTTAMNAVARVSEDLGYTVIGLAPSAAAAAVLSEATGIPTETLAKLDHLLKASQDVPVGPVGPSTVVVIDEAGMADTLTLDRVITACTARGARVRLIGDDQQLAAIGAGGVLRDIAATHGAVRLEEVVRFTDPSEAAASLDLRAGDRKALGFYLDHDRIHTGDLDTSLIDVLVGWIDDQDAGRESLMLAPTRDLVTRLNQAAHQFRFPESGRPGVGLADGNQACVGDTILTRHNDRRLGVSATDWVKNGDRWTITHINADGSLRARHLRSHLHVQLPAEYVAQHVELGYATTVHAAQGSTSDVMHGILTGTEDRQLLYTMLTRGRVENHLHLVLDTTQHGTGPRGDPEGEAFLPGITEHVTAVEILDRIIDRDGAAVSATSQAAHATAASTRLCAAARRYTDAVTLATQRVLGSDATAALESAALQIAAGGPGGGPLPWLPAIPVEVQADPGWSTYLSACASQVADLAAEVSETTPMPETLDRMASLLTPAQQEAIVLWRAAHGVPDTDRSILGPGINDPTGDRYARGLTREINAAYPPQIREWEARIQARLGYLDDHTIDLAQDLAHAQQSGLNADLILRRALVKPLPAERSTEALVYRVQWMVTQWRGVDAQDPRRGPTRPGAGLGL